MKIYIGKDKLDMAAHAAKMAAASLCAEPATFSFAGLSKSFAKGVSRFYSRHLS